eukprot:scaffold1948_cov244-Pinguiococcus_pyrenoidosus.AAC.4
MVFAPKLLECRALVLDDVLVAQPQEAGDLVERAAVAVIEAHPEAHDVPLCRRQGSEQCLLDICAKRIPFYIHVGVAVFIALEILHDGPRGVLHRGHGHAQSAHVVQIPLVDLRQLHDLLVRGRTLPL